MERLQQYDVVVVGGGTAGVSAAVGAAKTGAKTLLIERNAYLGGEATNSGVSALHLWGKSGAGCRRSRPACVK